MGPTIERSCVILTASRNRAAITENGVRHGPVDEHVYSICSVSISKPITDRARPDNKKRMPKVGGPSNEYRESMKAWMAIEMRSDIRVACNRTM